MKSHVYSTKRHFSFSSTELKQIGVTSLFASLFLGMRYGAEPIRVMYGVVPILLIFFLSTYFFLFLAVTAQKYVGIIMGYKSKYHFFPSGMGIGVITFLVSATNIPLFFPGYLSHSLIPSLRLGKFRAGIKNWEMAAIGVAGPAANMLISTLR